MKDFRYALEKEDKVCDDESVKPPERNPGI